MAFLHGRATKRRLPEARIPITHPIGPSGGFAERGDGGRGALSPSIDEPGKFNRIGGASIAASMALAVVMLGNTHALHFIKARHSRLVEALVVSVGGLMSSSCCLIQLILNAFSFGCAGFAALDVLRPFFMCLTFGALSTRTAFALGLVPGSGMPAVASAVSTTAGVKSRLASTVNKSDIQQLAASWLAAAVLSFLPEILKLMNSRGGWSARTPRSALGDKPSTTTVTILATVEGVKCEACAASLRGALRDIDKPVYDQTNADAAQPSSGVLTAAADWRSTQDTRITLTVQGMPASETPNQGELAEWAADHVRATCSAKGYQCLDMEVNNAQAAVQAPS